VQCNRAKAYLEHGCPTLWGSSFANCIIPTPPHHADSRP
jgi:hypothetical protein